jgi:type VI protein secretion system component Hcp
MAEGDLFLKIEGVTGGTKDKKLTGYMEILSYAWDGSNDGSAHTETGQGSGRVYLNDLRITKSVDAGTPNLAQFFVDGKHIPTAELIQRRAGGPTAAKWVSIKLKKCFISNWSVNARGGPPEERLSLNFAEISFDVYKQNEQGAEQSAGTMTYDIPAHSK